MMEEEIVTIDETDFVVIDRLNHKGDTYIYALGVENNNKVALLKETFEGDSAFIESVDESIQNEIIKLFLERTVI